MKSNKRMQALLSTAMCAAILFSMPPPYLRPKFLPCRGRKAKTLWRNSRRSTCSGSQARRPPTNTARMLCIICPILTFWAVMSVLWTSIAKKLTDGVKSSAGSIDFDSVVNFYSNSAFNNAENGAKFSNQNTVDFDLGQPKTIVEVNAYSSAGLTGRYAGSLGHIGKYSVYVSADKNQWTCVLDGKKLRRRHFRSRLAPMWPGMRFPRTRCRGTPMPPESTRSMCGLCLKQMRCGAIIPSSQRKKWRFWGRMARPRAPLSPLANKNLPPLRIWRGPPPTPTRLPPKNMC